MKRTLFAAMLATLSISALADGCSATGCVGYGSEAVSSVYVNGNGHIYLEAPAAERANLNCTPAGGAYMVLERTHASFKESYAAVLMAIASGRRLHVRIAEGSANCRVSYVRFYN